MTDLIDKDALGVEVSWSFGFGDAQAVTLPRADVAEVFAAEGFSHALPDLDHDDALKRASRYSKKSKTHMVKELSKPNKQTGAVRVYGVYKRVDVAGETGDRWKMEARVRTDGHRIVVLPPEDSAVFADPKCHQIGAMMAEMANSVLDNVMNVDMSMALTTIGADLYWVSRRRNSGGVYLMLSSEDTERFVRVLKGLEALTAESNRWEQFIPQIQEVYPKPLTMDSWAGSTEDAFQGEIDRLVKELGRMQSADGNMRDKTIEARADECDAIMAKAERYRSFLSGKVETIAASLVDLREKFRKGLDEDVAKIGGALDDMDATSKAAAEIDAKAAKKAAKKATKKAPKRRGRRVIAPADADLGMGDFDL